MNVPGQKVHAKRRAPKLLAVLCAVALAAFISAFLGCWSSTSENHGNNRAINYDPDRISTASRGHFEQAMDFLTGLDQFDSRQAREQILFHFNRWLEEQEEKTGAKIAAVPAVANDLIGTLPKTVEAQAVAAAISKPQFGPQDILYLRESLWYKQISESVVARNFQRRSDSQGPPTDGVAIPPTKAWFEQLEKNQGADVATDVRVAHWLFDWVVRNIQLDPVASQNYLFAWESLLFGHGKAEQRAQIFMGLCRQQRIPTVVIELGQPIDRQKSESSANNVPAGSALLVGAMIGSECYLFSPALGLPVPSAEGDGIATWRSLLTHVSRVAKRLNVGGHTFPLNAEVLAAARVYLDAAPAPLSTRLRMVEQRLSGTQKMQLTVDVKNFDSKSKAAGMEQGVSLWSVPYGLRQFRANPGRTPEMQQLAQETQLYVGLSSLMIARLRYFQGEFNDTPARKGCKGYLLMCRPADEQINLLHRDDELQKRLGIYDQLPREVDVRRRMLEVMKILVRRVKRNATYWLGLVAYENGQYRVAENFLGRLTVEATPGTPWINGAKYNLARTYEQQAILAAAAGELPTARDKLAAAIHIYLTDESPQQHGNRIRAEMLKKVVAKWEPERNENANNITSPSRTLPTDSARNKTSNPRHWTTHIRQISHR